MRSDMDHTVLPANYSTPCLPLLHSHRALPPFGWYSFYRPTEGRRLSRPGIFWRCWREAISPGTNMVDTSQEVIWAVDEIRRWSPVDLVYQLLLKSEPTWTLLLITVKIKIQWNIHTWIHEVTFGVISLLVEIFRSSIQIRIFDGKASSSYTSVFQLIVQK